MRSLYVITAINKLTKDRVTISCPMKKELCQNLLLEKKKEQHSHSVYSRMRMELYVTEPLLW